MKVRVLGSCGSRSQGGGTSCLLVNDRVLLDAGSAASTLSLEEQLAVEAVIISHSHLDHIVDLAFLVDNLLTLRTTPLPVWAPEEVLRTLKDHLFNDALWPDLTRLPTPAAPALVLHPLKSGERAAIAGLDLEWAPTRHPVPSAGYLLDDGRTAVIYSGDTSATDALWSLGRQCPNLGGVFVETTFPDRLAELAVTTGHLTPATLLQELEKLGRPEVPVKVFHLKPQFKAEILGELDSLTPFSLQVLEGGEEFTF